MDNKDYVCVNEYEYGAFVGTLDELQEMISEHGWSLGFCEFFEKGEKVDIKLEVVE